jgi:hypothetical protein
MPSTPKLLIALTQFAPQILHGLILREGYFPFGNGCQPVGIARATFQLFFKCAMKSLNNQTDFDSAILMSSKSRPGRDRKR